MSNEGNLFQFQKQSLFSIGIFKIGNSYVTYLGEILCCFVSEFRAHYLSQLALSSFMQFQETSAVQGHTNSLHNYQIIIY